MTTHDPRREVEKLRDHLASHDKPIVFLIGAGASCAVEDSDGNQLIPALIDLGERCEAAVGDLGKKFTDIYAVITEEVEDATDRRPANVEDFLTSIRMKIAAMGANDKLAGGNQAQWKKVEATIRGTIAGAALPDEAEIPHTLPHHALARWIGRTSRTSPIEIFTTNYDTLLERGLEDERIPVFDGFVGSRSPFFHTGSLLHADMGPGRGWTRIWKIHGSVNWTWEQARGGSRRIVRTHESADGELILPSSHKYDESRKQPYLAMLDHLGAALTGREDTILIAIGCSFIDQHINGVLFDVLDVAPRVHVVALQYEDPPLADELVERAQRYPNLLVYGPSRAVIGGKVGTWRLIEPVDARTEALLDVPFDSDAAPEPETEALTGRFRLGDFEWFARFLDAIAGSDD